MSEVTRELDVRRIPPPERHQTIFQTFDALGPDQAFVLVNDHEPKPLLYQFQAERSGGFEWNVLEASPERFRVEIRRRAGQGPRAITEYFETDHRRLDAIVDDVERLAGAGSLPEAAARFAEFACGLDRHIEAEEQILFPAFETATGMTGGGPTMVMRAEHVEIRRGLDTVAAALRAGNVAGYRDAVRGLVDTLQTHNMKEEHMLYPMADRATGGERERDELVRRAQAL